MSHFKANHNGHAEHTEFHRFNAFAPASFLVAHPFESLRPLKKVQGSVLWLRSNENLPSIYNHKKVVFSLIPVPGITCSQKTAICVHSPDTYQHTPFGSSHAVSTTSRPYAKLAIWKRKKINPLSKMLHRAIKPTGHGKGSYKKDRQHKQGERFKKENGWNGQRTEKRKNNRKTSPQNLTDQKLKDSLQKRGKSGTKTKRPLATVKHW